MPIAGTKAGRGICRRCGKEVALTHADLIRSHPCAGHPIGHTQAPEAPASVLWRTEQSAGAAAPPTRVGERLSERAVIIARIQALAEAVDRQMEGKAGMLMDVREMQRKVFNIILADLRGEEPR